MESQWGFVRARRLLGRKPLLGIHLIFLGELVVLEKLSVQFVCFNILFPIPITVIRYNSLSRRIKSRDVMVYPLSSRGMTKFCVDIYIAEVSSAHNVCAKNHYLAIVSTIVETDNPHIEIKPGLDLLGPILDKYIFAFQDKTNSDLCRLRTFMFPLKMGRKINVTSPRVMTPQVISKPLQMMSRISIVVSWGNHSS